MRTPADSPRSPINTKFPVLLQPAYLLIDSKLGLPVINLPLNVFSCRRGNKTRGNGHQVNRTTLNSGLTICRAADRGAYVAHKSWWAGQVLIFEKIDARLTWLIEGGGGRAPWRSSRPWADWQRSVKTRCNGYLDYGGRIKLEDGKNEVRKGVLS